VIAGTCASIWLVLDLAGITIKILGISITIPITEIIKALIS
jgi:hypothetical protein